MPDVSLWGWREKRSGGSAPSCFGVTIVLQLNSHKGACLLPLPPLLLPLRWENFEVILQISPHSLRACMQVGGGVCAKGQQSCRQLYAFLLY